MLYSVKYLHYILSLVHPLEKKQSKVVDVRRNEDSGGKSYK